MNHKCQSEHLSERHSLWRSIRQGCATELTIPKSSGSACSHPSHGGLQFSEVCRLLLHLLSQLRIWLHSKPNQAAIQHLSAYCSVGNSLFGLCFKFGCVPCQFFGGVMIHTLSGLNRFRLHTAKCFSVGCELASYLFSGAAKQFCNLFVCHIKTNNPTVRLLQELFSTIFTA